MYFSLGVALVAPLSLGNMTISSTDMNDMPVISPNWFLDPGDQEMAVQSVRRIREWAEAAGDIIIREYQPGVEVQSDEDILTWLQSNANLIWHAASSCKFCQFVFQSRYRTELCIGAMGSDDNSVAVLDSRARVRGVTGLRVVDASAFPMLPPGHPQSTVCKFLSHTSAYVFTSTC